MSTLYEMGLISICFWEKELIAIFHFSLEKVDITLARADITLERVAITIGQGADR